MAFSRAFEFFRGARRIEWLILLAAAVMVLVITSGNVSAPQTQPEGTELERRLASVLSSVEGAGRVKVLIYEKTAAQSAYGAQGDVTVGGVVIVADGAKDVRVSLELQRAAKAFLGIELQDIEVLSMDGGAQLGK